MLALSAARLGLDVVIFDPEPDCPASRVAAQTITAAYDDLDAVAQFAASVDAVTYEFENVPAETAAAAAQHAPLRPGAKALDVAQDRVTEKTFLNDHGAPTVAFRAVSTLEELHTAISELGLPAILKTRRFGYDGKGQAVIREMADAEDAFAAMKGQPAPPEEEKSNIAGVNWDKQANKWRVVTTKKGIRPKNADGQWTVWTNGSTNHVGRYASKAEAEAVNAPDQEARGRQWCREVEATKDLPYLPWCRSRILPPADWVQGKQYATIYFGFKGGPVGPVVVTVLKCRMRTDKKGVERQTWNTQVSRTFRKEQGFRQPPSTSAPSAAAIPK